MILERLQLTNFRGFESLDLSFEPDLTVLVGVNGCGKTSVIDALRIGFGQIQLKQTDLHMGATRLSLSASIGGHGVYALHGEQKSNFMKYGSGAPPRALTFFYTVNRQANDQTPGATKPRSWTVADARTPIAPGYPFFFQWYREMEDEENERIRYDEGTESPHLAAVRGAVARLLPGYSRLRVRRSGAMGDSRPRLTVEKDGVLLLFDALSEGERTIIAMIADIARRLAIAHPESNDPLAESFLLVIDEFEQHLHPQWQRELPSRMREVFPAAQVVLTTHSPIVVSELEPRQLRALQDFQLLDGAHREGQDVNEVLETLFGTPSRKPQTKDLIDAVDDALDETDLPRVAQHLDTLERQLGADDPEVVRLRTLQRMTSAPNHDAVSEG